MRDIELFSQMPLSAKINAFLLDNVHYAYCLLLSVQGSPRDFSGLCKWTSDRQLQSLHMPRLVRSHMCCILIKCNMVERQRCSIEGLSCERESPLEDPTGTGRDFLPREEKVERRGEERENPSCFLPVKKSSVPFSPFLAITQQLSAALLLL